MESKKQADMKMLVVPFRSFHAKLPENAVGKTETKHVLQTQTKKKKTVQNAI
jgi:hypothetical protein